MAQHSRHVPKFGNWDTDNVPYTAYFEHARREKGGVMMNPNDPFKNPEAFNHTCMRVGKNVDADEVMGSHGYSHNGNSLKNGSFGVLGNRTQRDVRGRSRGSNGGFTAEFVSEQSHFDHSVSHRSPQSDHKRNISKSSIKSFSSSSHNTNRSRNSSFDDHAHQNPSSNSKSGPRADIRQLIRTLSGI
ncbi:unnamed protein product [Sphenostylis stenocarpa]|uniref:RIN4 pathogenic type III effector avirulence factor Avr cleavage site domain-containing protein n=1 Tax=Sphenostylis stenocarpa TaxID=92480 RepID=A0AA86T0Z7_9FABA|nr:unnamed protein product [Sphenostylis stenocarpa]